MSKIRLHGSSSGYMEIAPPAAGSSETITLPNSAGEILLSDGSAASLTQIPAANIVGVCTAGLGNASGAFGQGITMADQWRITSAFNVAGSTHAYITSNWERNDNAGYAKIGTGMSESSGEFSFPTTGIYLVGINIVGYSIGGAFDYCQCNIDTTLDNSNYSTVAGTLESVERNSQYFAMATETLFDVTDILTHKVKFKVSSNNNRPYVNGSSSDNVSFAHFTRLGDT